MLVTSMIIVWKWNLSTETLCIDVPSGNVPSGKFPDLYDRVFSISDNIDESHVAKNFRLSMCVDESMSRCEKLKMLELKNALTDPAKISQTLCVVNS